MLKWWLPLWNKPFYRIVSHLSYAMKCLDQSLKAAINTVQLVNYHFLSCIQKKKLDWRPTWYCHIMSSWVARLWQECTIPGMWHWIKVKIWAILTKYNKLLITSWLTLSEIKYSTIVSFWCDMLSLISQWVWMRQKSSLLFLPHKH